MKKTLIASAILTALSSGSVQAFHEQTFPFSINITQMTLGSLNFSSGGSLSVTGDGNLFSIDPFFYHTWTASQQTDFLGNSSSWSGSSVQGAFDYTSDIQAMTTAQIAVGIFFNWNGQNEIAILEIFDCVAITLPNFGDCTGTGVAMQNGPFEGATIIFNSAPAAIVPIPASLWLMGTGLVGLVGFARRSKLKLNSIA